MAILTHGSDLSLAPTAGVLVRQNGMNLRTAVRSLAAAGFTSVQLDAALSGIRPRELNRRARKDLLAMVHREGVSLAGLDLPIPPDHFNDPVHVDRAVTAVTGAIELAADLGRLPLSITLPTAQLDDDILSALAQCADAHDVALSVHDEADVPALQSWIEQVDLPCVGAAIDPAIALAQKIDPAAWVLQLGRHLRVARLSDWSLPDRQIVGQGDLRVSEYRIAMDLAASRRGPVVLDLRGMANPLDAARRSAKAWEDAGFMS